MAEIIEAVTLTESNASEVCSWINSLIPNYSFVSRGSLFLHWHGDILVPVGYWLVRDSDDKIVMCEGSSFLPDWIPIHAEEDQ